MTLLSARLGGFRAIAFVIFGGAPFEQSNGTLTVIANRAAQSLEGLDQRRGSVTLDKVASAASI
jgi:hypothetical protein